MPGHPGKDPSTVQATGPAEVPVFILLAVAHAARLWCSQGLLTQSVRAAVRNSTHQVAHGQQKCVSHSSGGCSSKIRAVAVSVSEMACWSVDGAISLHPHIPKDQLVL